MEFKSAQLKRILENYKMVWAEMPKAHKRKVIWQHTQIMNDLLSAIENQERAEGTSRHLKPF